jgi:AcrR family transcriptional regulator
MDEKAGRARLGRNDWVMAALRALAKDGPAAVRVEALARDIGATKGSFYWHFIDLADLHRAMLDLWESVATRAITATVRGSGLDPRAQVMLLVDLAATAPGEPFGGVAVEPALRAWGQADAQVRAVVERIDRQRLDDLAAFLAAAGVPEGDLPSQAQLLYAAVIGLDSLRLTVGAEASQPLRMLTELILPAAPLSVGPVDPRDAHNHNFAGKIGS